MSDPGVTIEVLPAVTSGATNMPVRARRIRLGSADEIATELQRVYREARSGMIPLADACRLAFLLTSLAKLRESGDLARRIEALEQEIDHELA